MYNILAIELAMVAPTGSSDKSNIYKFFFVFFNFLFRIFDLTYLHTNDNNELFVITTSSLGLYHHLLFLYYQVEVLILNKREGFLYLNYWAKIFCFEKNKFRLNDVGHPISKRKEENKVLPSCLFLSPF